MPPNISPTSGRPGGRRDVGRSGPAVSAPRSSPSAGRAVSQPPALLEPTGNNAVRRLADDPHRSILDSLIRLSGPRLDWVSLDDLQTAVEVDGFDSTSSAAYLHDYLLDLETRMAVERHSRDEGADQFRPTTLAIEA